MEVDSEPEGYNASQRVRGSEDIESTNEVVKIIEAFVRAEKWLARLEKY
jgi:hypothetical protein